MFVVLSIYYLATLSAPLRQKNMQCIRRVLYRSGLAGAGAVRTLVRLISFPFALLYLLLYATVAHARRALYRAFNA